MTESTGRAAWVTAAVLTGRLIFTAMFLFAVSLKVMDVGATADQIAEAGFPMSRVLVWFAILAEAALVLCFATGAYFREAALFAAVYVVFLAFSFHGASHWITNQDEFGFFVDHFTFAAGLLFASAHGPGHRLAWKRSFFDRA
ncbi:MAG TPA: DoxX family protein [Gammaproteobacteria bacterium]|nr:DoxX family protein [Gammaproteobacteria bacterium]